MCLANPAIATLTRPTITTPTRDDIIDMRDSITTGTLDLTTTDTRTPTAINRRDSITIATRTPTAIGTWGTSTRAPTRTLTVISTRRLTGTRAPTTSG